jgi:hypothetical protein
VGYGHIAPHSVPAGAVVHVDMVVAEEGVAA